MLHVLAIFSPLAVVIVASMWLCTRSSAGGQASAFRRATAATVVLASVPGPSVAADWLKSRGGQAVVLDLKWIKEFATRPDQRKEAIAVLIDKKAKIWLERQGVPSIDASAALRKEAVANAREEVRSSAWTDVNKPPSIYVPELFHACEGPGPKGNGGDSVDYCCSTLGGYEAAQDVFGLAPVHAGLWDVADATELSRREQRDVYNICMHGRPKWSVK